MKTKHLLLILSFLILAIICNSVEDTLAHHYDTSIFAPLGHDSYFYPDWTRKYIDGDPAKGIRLIGYFPFLLDAWHLIKDIRWLLIGTLIFYFYVIGEPYALYEQRKLFRKYLIYIICYMALVWGVHKLFYDWILI